MSGYIDNYASPDNPVVDITGKPLGVLMNFADKGAASPTDHPLLGVPGLPGLPPPVVSLLTTPLSQMFDTAWAQTPGPDGKTVREKTRLQVISQVQSAVKGFGSGYSALGVRATLPETGSLKALIPLGSLTNPNASQLVLLSYQLTGFTVLFSVTTPFTGGLIPDPDYRLTFDVEFFVSIVIPLGVGPLTSLASFNVENASIDADNIIALAGDTILSAINFLSGQPTSIFQGAEGEIDTSTNATGSVGPFNSMLSALSAFWSVASGTFGFNQLIGFIDSQPALNFQFIHPVDAAPVLTNGADSPVPSLFHPQLGASAPVVKAGDSLGVTGLYFPPGLSSQLVITWTDTTSGHVTQSDISWGPSGGPPRLDSKPRSFDDNRNVFIASGLPASTSFTFSVRDQDFLTETPFSDPLTLTTQPTDLVELSIGPASGGLRRTIGSALLTLSGSFTAIVVIPADLTDGLYLISAALAGDVLATTGVRVVAAGGTVPPTLEAIDPATNLPEQSIVEGESLMLRGAGFRPGEVTITIDTPAGQALGVVTADSTGSFQSAFRWPLGVVGQRKALAEQSTGGPLLSASTDLFVQQIPR